MKRHVQILARARSDADNIFGWIAERSPQGAASWYEAFQAAAEALSVDAQQHPMAPEFRSIPQSVRDVHFRTRQGKRYRMLFVIVGDEVRILCIRGPGQPPAKSADLS